ncbi:conserved Plasmodium protein, unknown function [Plasmodium ovale curtisi]|uniref:Uncharacterized protein n=1 Tax=Plasmodium ovale curtisi TaxID=864141 RepID=A0A1A8W875_PLAOA|nr:conserved Plasmodium protein, unknown function [Plasmodium ovale curtisi]
MMNLEKGRYQFGEKLLDELRKLREYGLIQSALSYRVTTKREQRSIKRKKGYLYSSIESKYINKILYELFFRGKCVKTFATDNIYFPPCRVKKIVLLKKKKKVHLVVSVCDVPIETSLHLTNEGKSFFIFFKISHYVPNELLDHRAGCASSVFFFYHPRCSNGYRYSERYDNVRRKVFERLRKSNNLLERGICTSMSKRRNRSSVEERDAHFINPGEHREKLAYLPKMRKNMHTRKLVEHHVLLTNYSSYCKFSFSSFLHLFKRVLCEQLERSGGVRREKTLQTFGKNSDGRDVHSEEEMDNRGIHEEGNMQLRRLNVCSLSDNCDCLHVGSDGRGTYQIGKMSSFPNGGGSVRGQSDLRSEISHFIMKKKKFNCYDSIFTFIRSNLSNFSTMGAKISPRTKTMEKLKKIVYMLDKWSLLHKNGENTEERNDPDNCQYIINLLIELFLFFRLLYLNKKTVKKLQRYLSNRTLNGFAYYNFSNKHEERKKKKKIYMYTFCKYVDNFILAQEEDYMMSGKLFKKMEKLFGKCSNFNKNVCFKFAKRKLEKFCARVEDLIWWINHFEHASYPKRGEYSYFYFVTRKVEVLQNVTERKLGNNSQIIRHGSSDVHRSTLHDDFATTLRSIEQDRFGEKLQGKLRSVFAIRITLYEGTIIGITKCICTYLLHLFSKLEKFLNFGGVYMLKQVQVLIHSLHRCCFCSAKRKTKAFSLGKQGGLKEANYTDDLILNRFDEFHNDGVRNHPADGEPTQVSKALDKKLEKKKKKIAKGEKYANFFKLRNMKRVVYKCGTCLIDKAREKINEKEILFFLNVNMHKSELVQRVLRFQQEAGRLLGCLHQVWSSFAQKYATRGCGCYDCDCYDCDCYDCDCDYGGALPIEQGSVQKVLSGVCKQMQLNKNLSVFNMTREFLKRAKLDNTGGIDKINHKLLSSFLQPKKRPISKIFQSENSYVYKITLNYLAFFINAHMTYSVNIFSKNYEKLNNSEKEVYFVNIYKNELIKNKFIETTIFFLEFLFSYISQIVTFVKSGHPDGYDLGKKKKKKFYFNIRKIACYEIVQTELEVKKVFRVKKKGSFFLNVFVFPKSEILFFYSFLSDRSRGMCNPVFVKFLRQSGHYDVFLDSCNIRQEERMGTKSRRFATVPIHFCGDVVQGNSPYFPSFGSSVCITADFLKKYLVF